MIKRVVRLALLCLLLAGIGKEAQAQGLKVGYTDHEILILNLPEYKQVQEQLQKEYQGSQQSLQDRYKDYQDKVDKYQKQQALLSEERRAEREQELVTLQQDIQKAAATSEQTLGQKEAELMSPLFERVGTAINDVAKEKGLDLVLRSQAGQQPIILYVNEQTILDITPDVARKLGLDVEDEQASNNQSAPANQQ